jgi:hypothetical protein
MSPLSFRLLVAVVCAFSLTLALGATGASAACKPGMSKVGSADARTFCGPATSTSKVGGETIVLKGGECSTAGGFFSVNIGTVVLGKVASSKKPDYFGLTVGSGKATPKDGTYHKDIALAIDAKKRGFAIVDATVVLTSKLSKGTFSGTVFGSKKKVTGSFSCR